MENDFLLEWIWYWNQIMKLSKLNLLFYEELDKVKFSLSESVFMLL